MTKTKLTILALTLLPVAVFAQAAASPDMIDQVIQFLLGVASSIPAVGPYVAIVLKVLGVLAVILTSVSAALMAVSGAFNIVGLSSVAAFIQKILPYFQRASMFNVQKKEE